MAKHKDFLGNEYCTEDKVICISLERYNQLIIIEAEYNKEHKKICVNKESEER